MMADFVRQESIVRRIWGDGDVILLIFAGSAAEFSLNRAVDWLFFTGKLPRDPIGRLFSTAAYAQGIVFADEPTASSTLSRINAVHSAVERGRGEKIPDWAYRDVLYMLIDYSERAFELLYRRLTAGEQEELYDVFHRVGLGLGIPELPSNYSDWRIDRDLHLERDLILGDGTSALQAAYREHLGGWRYRLLLLVQSMLAPAHVRGLMNLRRVRGIRPMVRLYGLLARVGLRPVVHRLLMPSEHLPAVRALDSLASAQG
jgi:hypothetical protein